MESLKETPLARVAVGSTVRQNRSTAQEKVVGKRRWVAAFVTLVWLHRQSKGLKEAIRSRFKITLDVDIPLSSVVG